VLKAAVKIVANGWRVWVEHVVTGICHFQSDAEKMLKLATTSQSLYIKGRVLATGFFCGLGH